MEMEMEARFEVKTNLERDSIDITEYVENAAKGITDGIAFVSVRHTTCAIIINEAEKGLMEDYIEFCNHMVEGFKFRHDEVDNNGHAHVLASIIGDTKMVNVRDGKLDLAASQRVILLDFDGPRTRELQVKLLPL